MRGMVGSIGRGGGLLPSVLTLLLLFRLLIPSGYMIAVDHHGRPGLELCAIPVQAAAEAAVHESHDGHPGEPAPSKPGERPCPFAAPAAPPIPPEAPAVAPQSFTAALLPELPAGTDLPRLAAASPPPPARGPPLPV